MLLNMSAQFALREGFEEGAQFVLFAQGQQLDPAIAQISHGTGHVEPFCYLPDGIAKTDALDVSFKENLNRGDHTTED